MILTKVSTLVHVSATFFQYRHLHSLQESGLQSVQTGEGPIVYIGVFVEHYQPILQ